jgi:hypothetical protein
VICVIYLTLVYTALAAFGASSISDFEVASYVVKPQIVPVNSTQNDGIVQDEELAAGVIGGGVVGFVVGAVVVVLAAIVTAPAGGIGGVAALGLMTGSISIGALGGGLITGLEGDDPDSIGVGDALQAVTTFIGAFIGMYAFLLAFLFISPDIFGGYLPEYMYWLLYIMILPIWAYFAICITELALKAVSAVRGKGLV